MDVAGEHQADVAHSIYKTQLAPDGTELKHEKTERRWQQIISRVFMAHNAFGIQSPNTVYMRKCLIQIFPLTLHLSMVY